MEPSFSHHCHALAERHCNRGSLDCRWYHGNWELLKSLGVVSTSGVHAGELRDLLLQALPPGKASPAILISGSTDATLLQLLHGACLEAGLQPSVAAVDICATPLELMVEYAQLHDISLSKARADILSYTAASKYDVIFTHAFMGNFDDDGRAKLVRKWASVLTDGGRVVTVQRVRPVGSASLVQFSQEQARQFVAATLEAATRLDYLLPEERLRLGDAADAFTKNFKSYAITSREALEKLFVDAGFTFRHLQYQSLEKKSNLGGPSVPSGGNYAFIVAEKEAIL